jgi:putative serine protease PepD
MFRTRTVAAVCAVAALAAGLIGGGVGVLVADHGSSDSTTTVVRERAAAAAPASSGSLSVTDVVRKAAPGVVEITVGGSGANPFPGGGGSTQAQGSGFVYDDQGHIVTNEHVVDTATTASVRLPNGRSYSATVVGTDPSTDLAVLKVDAPASVLHPLALADSSQLAVGQGVIAIGSPFGLEGTVTSGIVSALHREIEAPNNRVIVDAIQTDAAINHGNSGGALLDLQGRVVGVTAQIKSDSGGNEGVGFAIPSNTVRSIVRGLLQNGSVQHAYLGVALASEGAARIQSVSDGTPAARAGLRAGDVVVGVDGSAITTGAELRAAIDAKQPGDTVQLRIRRAGSERTIAVKLAVRPD